MGGEQSKGLRSVSMRSPKEPTLVIDVSDEVVQRVKDEIKKQAREKAENPTASVVTPTKPLPIKSVQRPECSGCAKSAPPAMVSEQLSERSAGCGTPAVPRFASDKRSECFNSSKPAPTRMPHEKSGEHVEYAKPVLPEFRHEKRPQSPEVVKPAVPSPEQPEAIYVLPPSAMEVKRQIDMELKNNDAIWRQRIMKFEQTVKKSDKIMEEELSATMEKVQNRLAVVAPSNQPPPCHKDRKAELIACYHAHPGDPLKCSEQVANFKNCVDMFHAQVFDTMAGGDATTGKAD